MTRGGFYTVCGDMGWKFFVRFSVTTPESRGHGINSSNQGKPSQAGAWEGVISKELGKE